MENSYTETNVYELANDVAKEALNYGLLAEVIVFSLKYMKEDPSLTIEQAILAGYDDWVK
jgi:hypothetical protein